MEIELGCPACGSGIRVPGPPWPAGAACRCGNTAPLDSTSELANGRALDRCPVCGVNLFYVQKDFSRPVGISIVVIGVVLYLALPMPWSLVGLGGTWLLDLGLYFFIPWVTVCYKCRTIFRGFPRAAEHKTFDLNVAEQFLKE